MHLLTLVAAIEFACLVGNVIAWRRNRAWAKEMQACNRDLAVALQLAAMGRYDEAQAVAEAWRNRMQLWDWTATMWRVDEESKLREWPWWRRWLGL